MKTSTILRAASFAFATLACTRDELGSYRAFRNIELARSVEVILPSNVDAASVAAIQALAARTTERGRWSVEIERGREFDDSAARLWIADKDVIPLGRLVQLNGVVFEPQTGAVWFDGLRYAGPNEAVMLCLADPDRDGWPVTVIFASDASFAARFVTELEPTWKPGFRCWRAGRIEREGVWDPYGGQVESSATPVLAAIQTWANTPSTFAYGELVTHGSVEPKSLATYRAKLEALGPRVVEVLGEPRERVTVHVWPDQESFSAATGSSARSFVGFGEFEVHAIVEERTLDDAGRAFAVVLARSCAGRPREVWMEDALAVAASGMWQGVVSLERWREFLLRRDLLLGWPSVLEPPARRSSHVVDAQRALWIDALRRSQRSELVRRAWSEGAATLLSTTESIDRAFADALRSAEVTEPTATARATRRAGVLSRGFRKGAHLLPAIDLDGRSPWTYGSDASFRALDELRAQGVDAVALRPTYVRVDRTTFWPRTDPRGPFDSSVSDAQLLATAVYAREFGMSVMLAPQLLDAPASSLADASMGASLTNVTRYFEDQSSLLVHCGLLAQMADVDVLCIGSDLNESTNTQAFEIASGWMPPDHLLTHTQRWRDVLADVRNVFDGALTYAASGGGEVLSIDLWSELDYVGLDFYRVITTDYAKQKPPSDLEAERQIKGGLERLLEYAAQFDKPLLLTEVGFGATSRTWLDPEVPPGDYDVFEQQRMFAAFGRALRSVHRERGEPAGAFVWCWTIDPERGLGVDRGFTLRHRPAGERWADIFAED